MFRRASLTPFGWGSAFKIDPLTVAVRLPVLEADGRVGDEGRGYDCADTARVLRAGGTIKEIVRDLHVSRNTVRKVLRSGATEFSYEREVQPRPKLGAWTGELERILTANETKAARERLTLIRVFEELRGLGYEGGYDAVRRYARSWRRDRSAPVSAAFVPLSFAPGEAYQFDWSHEVVLINGVTVTIKVAHVRLCHSRMLFVRAYPRETQEMVFDAHDRAFAFFKGTCTRGIYDNMKTAVETIFAGKERAYNRRFLQMCGHYLVDPVRYARRRSVGLQRWATQPTADVRSLWEDNY